MISIKSLVIRGLLAGLFAGLLMGAAGLVLAEPSIERAIAIEEAAATTHGDEPTFDRRTQKFGLIAASGIFGLAIGGLFGWVFGFVARRVPESKRRQAALTLAFVAFTALFLAPFLKYPANPPAVGDPATVGARTSWYLAMIGISLVGAVGAGVLLPRLRARFSGFDARLIAVGGFLLIVGGAWFALPAPTDKITVPADLIWEFRLASVGTQVIFWTSLGLLFGASVAQPGVRSLLRPQARAV